MDWQELAEPKEIGAIQRSLIIGVGTLGKHVCYEMIGRFRLLDSLYRHQGTQISDLVHFVEVLDPTDRAVVRTFDNTVHNLAQEPVFDGVYTSRSETHDHFRASAKSIQDVIRCEIEQISRDSLRPSSDESPLYIFLIGSLCEVEGSIGFWSMASLCRKLIEDSGAANFVLTGICSVVSYKETTARDWELANAYIALQEARGLVDGTWAPWADSPLFCRDGWSLDALYLFGRDKENGLHSGQSNELIETISVLLEMFTLTSASRHIDEAILDDFTRKDEFYVSSCGVSVAAVPIQELHEFNSRRLTAEILQKNMLQASDESIGLAADLADRLVGPRAPLSMENVRSEVCNYLHLQIVHEADWDILWPEEIAVDPEHHFAQVPQPEWIALIEEYNHQLTSWETTVLDNQIRENSRSTATKLFEILVQDLIHLMKSANDGPMVTTLFLEQIGMSSARLMRDQVDLPGTTREQGSSQELHKLAAMIDNRPSRPAIMLRFLLLGILTLQALTAFYPTWQSTAPGVLKIPVVTFLLVETVFLAGAELYLANVKERLARQFRKAVFSYTALHKRRLINKIQEGTRSVYERVHDWARQSQTELNEVIKYLDDRCNDYLGERLQDIAYKSFLVFPVADLLKCQELYANIGPSSRQLATLDFLRGLDYELVLRSALAGDPASAGVMIIEVVHRFAFSHLPHPSIQKVERFIPSHTIGDLMLHMWNCAVPWLKAKTDSRAYGERGLSISMVTSVLNNDSDVVRAFCRDYNSVGFATVNPYAISLIRQRHGTRLESLSCWADLEKAYRSLGSDTEYLHTDRDWAAANLPAPFQDDSEARSDFRFLWHAWDERPIEDAFNSMTSVGAATPSDAEQTLDQFGAPDFVVSSEPPPPAVPRQRKPDVSSIVKHATLISVSSAVHSARPPGASAQGQPSNAEPVQSETSGHKDHPETTTRTNEGKISPALKTTDVNSEANPDQPLPQAKSTRSAWPTGVIRKFQKWWQAFTIQGTRGH